MTSMQLKQWEAIFAQQVVKIFIMMKFNGENGQNPESCWEFKQIEHSLQWILSKMCQTSIEMCQEHICVPEILLLQIFLKKQS